MKEKSCLPTLIAVYDEVDLRATDVVYVDFSKAFDTVSQTSS